MPLDAVQRQTIRAKVDELTRIRLEVDNTRVETCAGCGMTRDDWTPGCVTCWNRHRNWRQGRTKCPYRLGDLNAFAREVGVLIEQHTLMRSRDAIERYNAPRRTNAYA